MYYCKKHDRFYEDTSLTAFLPFWECPECREEESNEMQRLAIRDTPTTPTPKNLRCLNDEKPL